MLIVCCVPALFQRYLHMSLFWSHSAKDFFSLKHFFNYIRKVSSTELNAPMQKLDRHWQQMLCIGASVD